MIKSVICDLLGIERPLFQGGMAWIADARLAAAVSNAGGLGLISSINFGTEAVREEIRKCKTLTEKPFGVNIMLQAPNAGEVADMIIEEGIRIVTTGAGSPAAYMEKWKAAGIKVIPVVASVAYALKMQELGATAVVAEGAESGGHIGDLHTMALVPQVVDALVEHRAHVGEVGDQRAEAGFEVAHQRVELATGGPAVPVLAAGGIFDGRGVAAAFMLGAKGVQVGTRFLIADECHIHENYKARLIAASDVSTMVTGKSLGDAVRSLKTPFTKKFFKMEYDPTVPKEEVLKFGTGSMRKAVFDGDLAGGSFLAGEVAGMIKKKETAREIVEDLMDGAERLLAAAPELIAK